jgi:hypothetical protein
MSEICFDAAKNLTIVNGSSRVMRFGSKTYGDIEYKRSLINRWNIFRQRMYRSISISGYFISDVDWVFSYVVRQLLFSFFDYQINNKRDK